MSQACSVTCSAPQRRDTGAVVAELRSMALGALKRMYRPRERLFAFRLRRQGNQDVLEGISRRYTAIALIGLADEADEVVSDILGGCGKRELCGHLLETVDAATDVGEVALTLWAARALRHPDASRALERLKAMDPAGKSYPTVEVAWSLTAQAVEGGDGSDEALMHAIADRLLASFRRSTGLFAHYPAGAKCPLLRSHVACYADLVYPIQALSHYHRVTGRSEALEAARQCGQRMCELQGPEGQWWWHYDVRSGRVLEKFPVYAVHQDAMGPMALFALQEAGGGDYGEAIVRSLNWLQHSPELHGSLIDRPSGVIWRKVARHEPGKLTRTLQALASRVHPSLRVPGTDVLFRPGWVDDESRPYHMGWILLAFAGDRGERL